MLNKGKILYKSFSEQLNSKIIIPYYCIGTYLVRLLTSSISLQVFAKGVDKDMVVLMAARASRLENQDAIDAAIVSMLADPKEVLNPVKEICMQFIFILLISPSHI